MAALLIYAYYIHRHCLFGEAMTFGKPAATARPQRIGRFMLVSFGVVAIVVGAALFAAFKLDADRSREHLYVFLLIFALLGNLFVLSLFGTVLPAAAAGDPLGPAFGLTRIWATFWPIFGGLLIGPALVGLLGIVVLSFAGRALGPDAGKAVTFAFGVAESALGLVNTTLAVVVLCRAYRRVVPANPMPTDPAPGVSAA